MGGISGPNLRRVIKSCDIGEDGSKKSEGSDATVICSLEACPLEDAAATVLLPGWVLCTPVPPQISTHTTQYRKHGILTALLVVMLMVLLCWKIKWKFLNKLI